MEETWCSCWLTGPPHPALLAAFPFHPTGAFRERLERTHSLLVKGSGRTSDRIIRKYSAVCFTVCVYDVYNWGNAWRHQSGPPYGDKSCADRLDLNLTCMCGCVLGRLCMMWGKGCFLFIREGGHKVETYQALGAAHLPTSEETILLQNKVAIMKVKQVFLPLYSAKSNLTPPSPTCCCTLPVRQLLRFSILSRPWICALI